MRTPKPLRRVPGGPTTEEKRKAPMVANRLVVSVAVLLLLGVGGFSLSGCSGQNSDENNPMVVTETVNGTGEGDDHRAIAERLRKGGGGLADRRGETLISVGNARFPLA
jgi:hypothetical protein